MTASVYRLVTAGSTNLNQVRNGPANVKGIIAVNTAAYEIFVKLYWFRPTASATGPTVGTTPPDVTIALPALGTTTGGVMQSFADGFTGKTGNLFIAVTKLAADTDTTAVLAGDGLISLLVDPS
jgi:hypothetical protein